MADSLSDRGQRIEENIRIMEEAIRQRIEEEDRKRRDSLQ